MPYFLFCIHNHQPVGNFEDVIEENYRRSYLPFLSALSRHPRVKLSLHTTGFLLDWMIKNHPEYVEMLRSMVDAGQVEIIGGGYYEPILSVIPERDRVRQITLFSDRIEKVFRTRPRGIWLAERVWEPTLPTTIKNAGLEYLVVDDYHFIKSGLTREELGGYYITEDQGNVIKIFPGSEALRYLIPFKPPGELETHLRGLGGFLKRGNAAIYGDDGEKFGSWPGTHKWVFEDGWLESFLTMIEASLDWLTPLSLGEYLDMEEPVGQIYLPTTSYMEMGEWALPASASAEYARLANDIKGWKDGERVRRFMQGGVWRNFFSKYPESNWMHKRMLLASKALESKRTSAPGAPDLDIAERLIHQAQCNDAYWHGVFGGLYLPHLRTKVYQCIIEAENIIDSVAQDRCGVTLADLDADDHSEAVMRTRDLTLFIKPSAGASLAELDFKPAAVNLSNTLTRWHEGYHHKLEAREKGAVTAGAVSIHDIVKVKEEGLERYLKYDTFRRASFVDRILGADATIESFYANEFTEMGDLAAGRYDCEVKDTRVILSRAGNAGGSGIDVRKVFKPDGHDSFKAEYQIKGALAQGLRFAVEFNFLLPCCDGPATFYQAVPPMATSADIGLGSSGVMEGVEAITMSDTHTGLSLTIETERPATLWRFPVHTVSLSEGGFEKIYQGSCLVFIFDFDSRSAQTNLCFRVRVGSLER